MNVIVNTQTDKLTIMMEIHLTIVYPFFLLQITHFSHSSLSLQISNEFILIDHTSKMNFWHLSMHLQCVAAVNATKPNVVKQVCLTFCFSLFANGFPYVQSFQLNCYLLQFLPVTRYNNVLFLAVCIVFGCHMGRAG